VEDSGWVRSDYSEKFRGDKVRGDTATVEEWDALRTLVYRYRVGAAELKKKGACANGTSFWLFDEKRTNRTCRTNTGRSRSKGCQHGAHSTILG
jgi:hypothetical protein